MRFAHTANVAEMKSWLSVVTVSGVKVQLHRDTVACKNLVKLPVTVNSSGRKDELIF